MVTNTLVSAKDIIKAGIVAMIRSSSPRRASLASSIIWRFVFYATLPVVIIGAVSLLLVTRRMGITILPIKQLAVFFVTILVVFGILSAGGGWFMARWLSRLFAYLSHNARRIARGDYNAQMPTQRHQELEALAEDIRSMVTAVRDREDQYRELI